MSISPTTLNLESSLEETVYQLGQIENSSSFSKKLIFSTTIPKPTVIATSITAKTYHPLPPLWTDDEVYLKSSLAAVVAIFVTVYFFGS